LSRLRSYEITRFVPIYLGYSFAALRLKLHTTPTWFDGSLEANHSAFLAFVGTNNEQSRIFQWLIPEFLHRAGLSVASAYGLQRYVFVAIALTLFHVFCRRWLSPMASFAAVSVFVALLPMTARNDLQESLPLLLVVFLVGLWCIREGWDLALAAVVLIGVLVNETMLILAVAYVFVRWSPIADHAQLFTTMRRGLLIFAPALAIWLLVRYATRDNPHLGGDVLRIIANINDRRAYAEVLGIYGVFWLYAVLAYRRLPYFLKRTLWLVPFFIAANAVTGIITETRQLLPLAYIVLPSALLYLFPVQLTDMRSPSVTAPINPR